MTPIDWFIYLVGGTGLALIVLGVCILNNRRLEIGALVGVYPLGIGFAMSALAALIWCLLYVRLSIHTV